MWELNLVIFGLASALAGAGLALLFVWWLFGPRTGTETFENRDQQEGPFRLHCEACGHHNFWKNERCVVCDTKLPWITPEAEERMALSWYEHAAYENVRPVVRNWLYAMIQKYKLTVVSRLTPEQRLLMDMECCGTTTTSPPTTTRPPVPAYEEYEAQRRVEGGSGSDYCNDQIFRLERALDEWDPSHD